MKTRSKQRASKRDRNSRRRPGMGKSKYARKNAWLHAHGVWGFEVPSPKPWKSS